MLGSAPPQRGYGGTGWKKKENLLFEDDADRERLLSSLAERVEQYNIRLYLFVFMANHVHFIFETPEGNCSKFMHSLSTAYTVYFNRRHGRHGHLFDGRYKAKLVEGDEYLLALSRYVHLNPVKTASMEKVPIQEKIRYLRQYRWSSYPSYIGRRKALDFVSYGPMLGRMRGKGRDRPKRYREFVEAGLAEDDPSSLGSRVTSDEFKVALRESPRSVGSDGFRAWVDAFYQELVEAHHRPEDISFRKITEPVAPSAVLEVLAGVFMVDVKEFRQRRRNSALRGIAAKYLCRYAGLTQRQVAEVLEVGSGAAVSQQMKKLAKESPKDRRLRRLIKQAEERLEALR